jgi:hypothetical protein
MARKTGNTGALARAYAGWFERGFADAKTLAAGVFAVAGIGLAVWSVAGTGGGEAAPEPASGERVHSTLDSEGEPIEASYSSTRGSDAGAVVSGLASLAMERAPAVDGFGTQGAGSAAALGDSVELALGGLISGDADAFAEAMRALGGALDEDLDGEHPLFGHLKGKLAGAKVDMDRLEVRPYQSRRGGPRMIREEPPEGAEGEPRQNYNEQVREMRPGDLFADASAAIDEKAIEVRFPFLARGSDDEEWFGLILVWNEPLGLWQPGAFQMIKRELTVSP